MTIPANSISAQALAHRFMDVIDEEINAQPSTVIVALIRTLACALRTSLPNDVEKAIEMTNQVLRQEMSQ
jgi:hypothetical protein